MGSTMKRRPMDDGRWTMAHVGAYLRFTIWMLARYARGCGASAMWNFGNSAKGWLERVEEYAAPS